MKKFIFIFFLIGLSSSFAGQNWKSAGEYFENQYLTALREQLKKRDLCVANLTALLPLKQAFLIYQVEAAKGNVDAQFRLGMYEQAAAGGHEYAVLSQQALEDHEEIDSRKFCTFYGGQLLSDKKTKANAAHYVESLALLGNADCMLALGRSKHSTYWLQRAVLAAPSRELEGEASYELGLALARDTSCHPKS